MIDRLHTENPAWGARQVSAQLKRRGHNVGRRKARRYMTEMEIDHIYPEMNLFKRMQQAKVCPYLLRSAVIGRPKFRHLLSKELSVQVGYLAGCGDKNVIMEAEWTDLSRQSFRWLKYAVANSKWLLTRTRAKAIIKTTYMRMYRR